MTEAIEPVRRIVVADENDRSRAIADGPSNEPHGPLRYPEGCQLFSLFHGSYYHSEVESLATEQHYRLIRSAPIPCR